MDDKLQKVKITLRKSERWFRVIFSQIFGFIGLMQLMGILMKGNQTALKFGGITSKVVRCPLWSACWTDFSRDGEDRDRQENPNTGLAIVKKIVEISGGRITSDSQIGIRSYFIIYLV
ncbi:HAMP domain-containing histidine kinase [Nostoc sphaeroides CHAB 2801]|uniref:HAMP domain-containing histidine kinase n=1 Tax=Nostoc sphaeroides TaxID=446679 RepID=UPI000E4F88FC|nr:HAMP domain-containing histidine kinase [Nostoc sphaeroides]MCC5630532.1 HAMP domain-containing histidine kinase [Nostoc sphaeroides CHAB 2801]